MIETKPVRIQRKRTKGWKMPVNTIYVGRPTRFGNPFKVGEVNTDTGEIVTLEKCLEYFRFYLHRKYQGAALAEFLEPLRGKDLACFCKSGQPCHADILLELANETR
jgi:hypothetical protein